MTIIAWNSPGEKTFYSGLHNGVLYTDNGSGIYTGHAWNGLISVDIGSTIADPKQVYQDGIPYASVPNNNAFSASITAYTYPDEFEKCLGMYRVSPLNLTFNDQPQSDFRMSYVNYIGNDVEGPDAHYQIHLLYNLVAVPGNLNHATNGSDTEAMELTFDISGIPEHTTYNNPTVHIIMDSRMLLPTIMNKVKGILYGTAITDPHLPGLQEFMDIVYGEPLLVIEYITDPVLGNVWRATAPDDSGIIDMTSPTTFDIDWYTALPVDAESFRIETG